MSNDKRCAGELWRAPNVRNVLLLSGTSAEPLVYNTLYKYKLAEISG
jgi:hypothetical protein